MADIREQDLALKTTIADTDWMRLVTPTGNHRMTVGQFKDLIGYTQAKSDISQLQTDVASLVDSGSNANGSYVKFSDGTMICWKHTPSNIVSTASLSEGGETVYYCEMVWNFPQEFIAKTVEINYRLKSGTTLRYRMLKPTIALLTNATIIYRPSCLSNFDRVDDEQLIAIGRWK